MAAIEDILQVERIETDIYRGPAFPSHLQRTFGGQVAGQALMSATRTVDDEFAVHSLHGYFLRPGNPDLPAVFLVDRIRDGRSFVTRRVTGIQNGEAIFMMSASFHVRTDQGYEHQDRMPPVLKPTELPDRLDDFSAEERAVFKEWQNFDIRIVPREHLVTSDYFAAQQRVWFRYRHRLPDDQVFHVGTLAYMSDMTLLGSSKVPHPDANPQVASLDHAMWFMRPFRADDWLLYDQTSPSADGGRALTQGRIFDLSGRMVAAVTQEGLARTGRDMPADQHARRDR
ncbi:acyl-CoA thioesterase [Gordonia bronchialis DSM 43247]|uniref:Acyl-CoA thioesterase 2 n=1 Tax=Gordonia bronchialis (strain ATCC 25592 / DSM 43247 / BCRC 13721 / JCM 3198 / KCTC 3076 / NBRC 16047 / NCTC 10667) TaxID=526226 RepID=D0LCM1_GORB4|nr:acyl-CoA thioesterase II [Gordonia bronchialis]ACY21542.1 acyl-CoA thioesterase [Gordonia bronchialis DSM 43247]MCC3324327.1 acyl-CoA thioesterase II [Gordonia bronchialis]QGS24816.1 acyl-CoA thioesterase II [Gordonia bronchialis]UAK38937.1 acyl-CoA thioesterase II [Gordonia bronchialis]STQ64424.1 Acyl-CoA thioesterase 2 [Gordonia bronchialis]